ALILVSIFFVGSQSNADCLDPPPGLVSWWPGDGNARDIIGTNNGDLINGATFAEGMVDGAFSFDGEDDLVATSGTDIENLQALTIDAWVMHNLLPSSRIQRYVTLADKAVIRYDGENGPRQLHFYMTINGDLHHIRVNEVLQEGVFQHVAGTYDGSFMRLYLDGLEVGSLEVSGVLGPAPWVGFGSSDESLDGLLDEVEIYDHALSASEIQAIYSAGSEGKCKPDVGEGYQLGWVSIQHRVYEPIKYECTKTINVLAFDMQDANGDYLTDGSVVTNVKLIDPAENVVNLSSVTFEEYDYKGARFDRSAASWTYYDTLSLSEFDADILDPLVIGTYKLEVTTKDGITHEKPIEFDFLLKLPVISSDTFQIHSDQDGNIYWMWDIPRELLSIAENYSTSIRAGIGAYENDDLKLLVWPNVPTHMGCLFLPEYVVQELINRGNEFSFILQVRTDNSIARANSKSVRVYDLYQTIYKNDLYQTIYRKRWWWRW
ncbi:MAG: LamG domain-containing protein, partial [Desulfobacterales bacterium]